MHSRLITPMILCLLTTVSAYSDIVWSDEFDGTVIDKKIWTYDIGGGGWGNGQLEYNTARRENSYIENGNLVIEARRELYQEATTNQFTSARMLTQGRFAFKYGSLEARIKLPNVANGLWPAFWMLGNNFPGIDWPVCGETDILEVGSKEGIAEGTQNKRFNSAVHYDNNGTYNFNTNWVTADINLNEDYHLYKLQWTPTEMTFYLDGIPHWSFDITADYLREFHQPFFPILNIAIGSWPTGYTGIYDPGAITASFPAKMYIDYLRLESNEYTEVYYGDDIAEDGNFGVFTETMPVEDALVYGDTTDPEFNYQNTAALYIWNNMTEVTPPIAPYEGSECWSFNINAGTWFGMGVCLPNFRNMENYSDGFLHLHMATTTTDKIKIGIKSSVGDESWVYLENAGETFGLVRDGDWHEVIIPLNRFKNIDFQTVHQMFMIAGDATMTTNLSMDNIWWEPSIARATPENGNFGVFTEDASNQTAGQYILDQDGQFFIWEKTLVNGTQNPYEGDASLSLNSATGMTWFGCAFTPTTKYNLTAFRYPESKLHFAMKTSSTVTFRIGMKSGNVDGIGQKWITFASGSDPYDFVRDGNWHVIEIPMSVFTTEVDLSEVSQFFEILGTNGPITNIELDDICFIGGSSALVDEESNTPPAVSITSPINGTFFAPGDNITITADATDADGTITKVEFYEGSNLLGEDTSSPYSYTWNSIPEGAYTFRAKTFDNDDVSRTSSPVTIYVGTPQLAAVTISPSSASLEVGDTQQFTAAGLDQFGQPFAIDPIWSVSGGGTIDEDGLFTTAYPGQFTVTVQAGAFSKTATITIAKPTGTCTGGPTNGDYTYEVSGDTSNPTITFVPGRTGVGSSTVILYYSKSSSGVYPGYRVSPNVPYTITASEGQTVYFYYTYNIPEGGENSTVNSKHSVVVGDCGSIVAGDINGDEVVDINDICMLAYYWLMTCTSDDDYCYGADTQPDGNVNLLDMAYISQHWLN